MFSRMTAAISKANFPQESSVKHWNFENEQRHKLHMPRALKQSRGDASGGDQRSKVTSASCSQSNQIARFFTALPDLDDLWQKT